MHYNNFWLKKRTFQWISVFMAFGLFTLWCITVLSFANDLLDFSTDQLTIDNLESFTDMREEYVSINTSTCPKPFKCPSLVIPLVITLCVETEVDEDDVDFERKRKLIRQEEQIRAMFASLLFFSKEPIWRIIVVTDSVKTFQAVVDLVSLWSVQDRLRLKLERRQIQMPDNLFLKKWRPCCWAKMFLDKMLPEFQFIVYIDTDFLFLGPAEEIWDQVSALRDSEAMVAYAPEPWYKHENFSRTTAGKMGLNTGIALINLQKSRLIEYGNLLLQEINRTILPRHDQDVANSFLAKYPNLLLELSPRFNFSPSICTENISCAECLSKGIIALHGADASFYKLVDLRIQTTFAIMVDFSKEFSTLPQRLFKLLTTQLHLVQTSRIRKTACTNYTDFADMLLYSFKNKIKLLNNY